MRQNPGEEARWLNNTFVCAFCVQRSVEMQLPKSQNSRKYDFQPLQKIHKNLASRPPVSLRVVKVFQKQSNYFLFSETQFHIQSVYSVLPLQKILLTMMLHSDTLYVGTNDSFHVIPVAGCSVYKSQMSCLLSQSPYCSWNIDSSTCEANING